MDIVISFMFLSATRTAFCSSIKSFGHQTTLWMKVALGTEVGLSPGNIVLDRDPFPPKKMSTAAPPLFGPYHCGQTAGWIKMPLGTEIGLSPVRIVLDGDPAPPRKGAQQPPLFAPGLL